MKLLRLIGYCSSYINLQVWNIVTYVAFCLSSMRLHDKLQNGDLLDTKKSSIRFWQFMQYFLLFIEYLLCMG